MALFANIIFVILVFLAIPIGLIILQIFLCRKNRKWLGLVLPAICFALSLLILIGMVAFTMNTSVGSTVTREYDDYGNLVNEIYEEVYEEDTEAEDNTTVSFAMVILFFLYANIPTIIFLIIHLYYRSKFKKLRDIEKMSIQDLE